MGDNFAKANTTFFLSTFIFSMKRKRKKIENLDIARPHTRHWATLATHKFVDHVQLGCTTTSEVHTARAVPCHHSCLSGARLFPCTRCSDPQSHCFDTRSRYSINSQFHYSTLDTVHLIQIKIQPKLINQCEIGDIDSRKPYVILTLTSIQWCFQFSRN